MESEKIYEESRKEIIRVRRSLSSDKVTIDFSKLDSESAGLIRNTLSGVLSKRNTSITNIITGAR